MLHLYELSQIMSRDKKNSKDVIYRQKTRKNVLALSWALQELSTLNIHEEM